MAGWLYRQGLAEPIHAYSWAFEELPQCDERHISDLIVRHYDLPVSYVSADEAWPLKDYPKHGPDKDEPYIWVYQALMEQTLERVRSEGIGPILTGDRGDEVVGDWVFDYPGLVTTGQWRALWHELQAHKQWAGTSRRKIAKHYLVKPMLPMLIPQVHAASPPSSQSAYPDWVQPDFAERVGLADIIQQSEVQPNVRGYAQRMRYQRIFSLSGARIARLRDRTRARFGLGFADPWSDRRIASFVLAVPQWVVQRPSQPKRVARQAMRGIMPEAVQRTSAKIIPESLYARGFKERAVSTVLDLLTGSQAEARGYLDERTFRDYYKATLHGGPESYDPWWVLTLEMWLRRHWTDGNP
jgi:asparagine synthase (glutamine-hydrolysing)